MLILCDSILSSFRLMAANTNKNKILITGSTSGLGLVLSKYFFDKGFEIVAMGQSEEKLKELKKSTGPSLKTICLDLNSPSLIEKELSHIEDVHFVVHCAGGSTGVRETFPTHSDFTKVLNVNLISATEINRILIPKMKSSKFGRILHIGSTAGIDAHPQSAYASAKLAIHAYVKCAAREVISDGILISGLIPGAFIAPENAMERFKKFNENGFKDFLKNTVQTENLTKAEEFIPLIEFFFGESGHIFTGSMIPVDSSLSTAIR